MAKKLPISEQIRRAILDSPKSQYRIAQETGISEGNLSRFTRGIHGMQLSSIDKIGTCLGLRVVAEDEKPKRKKER